MFGDQRSLQIMRFRLKALGEAEPKGSLHASLRVGFHERYQHVCVYSGDVASTGNCLTNTLATINPLNT